MVCEYEKAIETIIDYDGFVIEHGDVVIVARFKEGVFIVTVSVGNDVPSGVDVSVDDIMDLPQVRGFGLST